MRSKLSFLLFFYLLVVSQVTFARPIDDVIFNRNWKEPAYVDQNTGERWYINESNYGYLFTYEAYIDRDKETPLVDWLARSTSFERASKVYTKFSDFVFGKLVYLTKDKIEISVRIYVPHPKAYSALELHLVPEFANIEPPKLRVESAEPIDIDGHPAQLYQQKDGGGSVLVKLDKKAVLQLSIKDYAYTKSMLKLADEIDIDRLNRKLRS